MHHDDTAARPTRVGRNEQILDAIAAGAVTATFQPIVRLADRQIVGAEALARLEIGSGERVDPREFIPLATRHGLLDEVLFHVLDDAVRVLDDRPEHAYISVNLAGPQLETEDIGCHLVEATRAAGLPLDRFVLELSERTLVELGRPEVRAEFDAIRALGVRLAVDDFGVGYSNLAGLLALRPDIIKIDRSLVHGLPELPWTDVIRALVALGDSSGATLVAEGVERDAQVEVLLELGVAAGQGFLLGRPDRSLPAPRSLSPAEECDAHGRPPLIGVIDDEQSVVDMVGDLLTEVGGDVVLRRTGSAEFLAAIRRKSLDIAIVDLLLDGHEDGLRSLVRPLRFLRPDVGVVVYSSVDDPLVRREAEALGCRWVDKVDGSVALLDAVAEAVAAQEGALVMNRATRPSPDPG